MIKRNKKIEENILEVVKAVKGSPAKVFSGLQIDNPSLSESDARQMVWRLVDRGQLSFTDCRTFSIRK